MATVRRVKRVRGEITCEVQPKPGDLDNLIRAACNPRKCHYKIAVLRVLSEKLRGAVTKVWVDGAVIKFTWAGWRWMMAPTPKTVKAGLIHLDKWDRSPPSKKETFSLDRKLLLRPFKLMATQQSKERKATREELDEMAERRRRRIAAGFPDKPRTKLTLRDRVVGIA